MKVLLVTVAIVGLGVSYTPALAGPTARSEFTPLDSCKQLGRLADELPDSFKSICPGRDGMRVIFEGGDGRSWIGLLPPGAKYDQGTRLHANWGGFPEVTGKRLEWRYDGGKLTALIVRVKETEWSGLTVWRVDAANPDQACLIGKTTSNEEAQAIADDLSRGCLEKN
jgi:hypothetical protein